MAGYPPSGSGYPPYGAPPAQPYYGAPAGDQKPNKPHKTDPYGVGAAPGAYGGAPPVQPYYGDQKPHKTDPYGGGGAYGAAPPAQPYYGDQKPHKSDPYGGDAPLAQPYYGDQKPHKTDPYGGGAPSHGGAYGAAPPAQPYYGAPTGDHKPHKTDPYGGAAPAHGGGYGAAPPPPAGAYGLAPAYGANPFAALTPSAFPPGTDPNVVACFQSSDTDGSGFIDDKEMQRALSSYNQTFSMRTVHLLMYMFTCSNVRKIGPKEFSSMFYSLQDWRSKFKRFDRDRSGRIDTNELRDALMNLGFAVPPVVLDLLVSKFDTSSSGGRNKSIEYDNFIECCLTVKGLTEKFKEKDVMYSGSANFTYESFMLTVLPFLIA